MIFNQQTSVYHPFDGQNPQQEKGGALLFLCALGEIWTRYGPCHGAGVNSLTKSIL